MQVFFIILYSIANSKPKINKRFTIIFKKRIDDER